MVAVDGLLDAAHAGSTVGAGRGVPGRRMAIHNLTVLELALKVSGDEIPSAHVQATRRSEGRKNPQGRGPQRGAEGLIVIDAVNLRASLDTEAGFQGAAAFAFIYPYEAHE
eukprot:5878272-Pleurochrysis_carterae.AAC.1